MFREKVSTKSDEDQPLKQRPCGILFSVGPVAANVRSPMEPSKSSVIEEARQLIGEYEKQTKQLFFAYLVMAVLSVVVLGVFAYGQIKANEIERRSAAIMDGEHQSDAFMEVNRMINVKIDLLRAEM